MYGKFATSTGIPQHKQNEVMKHAGAGRRSVSKLRNSAALRIEPTSYHLTPHVDVFEKLVTWQFFHPETDELKDRGVGTRFYQLRPEFQNSFQLNERRNPPWLDYSHFETVKEHPVIPNYFFSFAPSNQSWHGAEITPIKMRGVNQHARRTFLGFITTTKWNFHHFHNKDWAPEEYDFVVSN